MSTGRSSVTLSNTDSQVKLGLTKLHAVMCSENDGGRYDIYDTDIGAVDGDPIVSITPDAGSELQFKGLTFKKGLFVSLLLISLKTTALTVIYE